MGKVGPPPGAHLEIREQVDRYSECVTESCGLYLE
jgi:hypothetical protein